ncbi:MAG TPA: hypothetical protein PK800_04950, partial [Syntrophorhabdaceae bacterium]|nr:hypothetical protein [Syntrophorhabdaceae bacterium]
MAIEPVKKVTIVNTREAQRRLIKTINNLGIMEIIDVKSILKDDAPFITPKVDTSEADGNLNKIDFILNLINTFLPEKENFLKSLTPLPVVTSEEELNKILEDYNLERHYKYAVTLDETYRNAERIIAEIETEMEDLRPLLDLDINLEEFYSTKRIKMLIGYVPEKRLEAIDEKEEIWQWIAWEKLSLPEGVRTKKDRKDTGTKIKVVFAFLKEYEDEVKRLLTELNFEEIALPKRKEKAKERILELEEDRENYKNKIAEVAEHVNSLLEGLTPQEAKRRLIILKAYWTNIKNRQLATMKGVEGKWVYVISGYIRAKDSELLKNTIEKEFPQSILTIEDPS